jgi:hypothetical protein
VERSFLGDFERGTIAGLPLLDRFLADFQALGQAFLTEFVDLAGAFELLGKVHFRAV